MVINIINMVIKVKFGHHLNHLKNVPIFLVRIPGENNVAQILGQRFFEERS